MVSDLIQEKLNAYLAEYQALRSEIEWLIRDSTQYQKFAFTLLGIVFMALGWITQKAPDLIVPTLLAVPYLFCVLGLLYIRQHEEVYIVAAYLKEHMRPKIRSLLSDQHLWGWEEFKAKRTNELLEGSFLKPLSTGRMINILRTMLFAVPSFVSVVAVTVYAFSKGFHNLLGIYDWGLSMVLIICYLFDLIVLSYFLGYQFARTNLAKRFGFY